MSLVTLVIFTSVPNVTGLPSIVSFAVTSPVPVSSFATIVAGSTVIVTFASSQLSGLSISQSVYVSVYVPAGVFAGTVASPVAGSISSGVSLVTFVMFTSVPSVTDAPFSVSLAVTSPSAVSSTASIGSIVFNNVTVGSSSVLELSSDMSVSESPFVPPPAFAVTVAWLVTLPSATFAAVIL